MLRTFCCLILFFSTLLQVAEAQTLTIVKNIRIWHAPDHTRIVFDISAPVSFRTEFNNLAKNYIVDIKDSINKAQLPTIQSNPRISQISANRLEQQGFRFTIPTKKPLKLNSFQLRPNEVYGHRLVIDLFDQKESDTSVGKSDDEAKTIEEIFAANPSGIKQNNTSTNKKTTSSNSGAASLPVKTATQAKRKTIIVIDAGHGGEDPGAIGFRGTREKHVTLAISKKLAALVNRNPNFKAVLTRKNDYFIRLRGRTNQARKAQADLFVSIHADAALDRRARGMSVFALSQRGASSELARALAKKQNQADLVGGVSIKDKDDNLAEVLLDLSMTNKISESVDLGKSILKHLSPLGKLHSKRVEQAGFVVLKTPDIPSVLVETGFISNKQEESLLRTSKHQQRLAEAIYAGLVDYVKNNPSQFGNSNYQLVNVSENNESDILFSEEVLFHTVKRGDSLSLIAQRYGVKISQIKQWNNLKNNVVRQGQKLKIITDQIPNEPVFEPAKKTIRYTVIRGDTLSEIADRHGVTMSAIRRSNNLKSNQVYIGQRLKITVTENNNSSLTTTPSVHKVHNGESLSSISARYNIKISQLKRLNNLASNKITIGQILRLSSSAPPTNKPKSITHKVTNGQTLSGLALKYRVSQNDIVAWNNLKKRQLYIGQKLIIKQ